MVLPAAFTTWLQEANAFCSTLVDRIVTGYPRDEAAAIEAQLGYKDGFLATAEHFYLFVIQGQNRWPLNCVWINCHLMS